MRRYLIIALLIVIILTIIIWVVSLFIPYDISQKGIAVIAVFLGVIAALAGFKDISELIKSVFEKSKLITKKNRSINDELVLLQQLKDAEDNLHDLSGWFFSGVVHPLEIIEHHVKQQKYDEIEQYLPIVIDRARDVGQELKNIHTNLYTNILEERNLLTALNKIIDMFLSRIYYPFDKPMNMTVDCQSNLNLPNTQHQEFLKITINAISNAIYHSGILTDPNVSIKIICQNNENQIILRVLDDGFGNENIKEGYGIMRMHNLVQQMNNQGTVTHLDIDSKIGKGTSVILKMVGRN